MKRTSLSNTHPGGPQSQGDEAIPIGERWRRERSVVNYVHASRKWVARRGAILLARTRFLYLREFYKAAGMLALSSRTSRRVNGAARATMSVLLAFFSAGSALGGQQSPQAQQGTAPAAGQATVQKSSEPGAPQRIPRQQALTTAALD